MRVEIGIEPRYMECICRSRFKAVRAVLFLLSRLVEEVKQKAAGRVGHQIPKFYDPGIFLAARVCG